MVVVYARWMFARALLHRGWWLVTSLYLVVEAQLSPLQLIFIGTAQGIAVLCFEVPTGLVADNTSRKWSIVISHLLMGSAMLATSMVVSYPLLLLTQILWGISWTFSSGADVAWLTDEVDEPADTGRYLGIAARWELIGSAIGLAVFGLLAWWVSMALSMAVAGCLMLLLSFIVITQFTEQRFKKNESSNLASLRTTLHEGLALAKAGKVIFTVLAVTFLVNGADELFTRLFAKRLVEMGMPQIVEPILWLTLLGVVTLAVGAVALRVVEARLREEGSIRVLYCAGCVLGAAGLVLFAGAPNYLVGMSGVLLIHGLAWNVVRVVGVIWLNNHARSESRATLQSFLSFSENLGEITLGFALGLFAQMAGISLAVSVAGVLALIAGYLVFKCHTS